MLADPKPSDATPSAATPGDATPRLHVGGKLSFRRRVPRSDPADTAALPLVPHSEDPPPLRALIPAGIARVEIEIGPGKGTFLLAATEASPDTFLLGIEAASGYAHYAAQRLARTGRKNGLLLVDNARVYLRDRVDPHSVARVHIYFPDPWPKRRHRKRRFFSGDIAEILCRAIVSGGHLLTSTDNPAYAGQICAVLGQSPELERDEGEEQRLNALPPGHGFGPTNFERKYREDRRTIRRYAYRRR
jgi:tRNA (guanine-N7-)-methyltransferase